MFVFPRVMQDYMELRITTILEGLKGFVFVRAGGMESRTITLELSCENQGSALSVFKAGVLHSQTMPF